MSAKVSDLPVPATIGPQLGRMIRGDARGDVRGDVLSERPISEREVAEREVAQGLGSQIRSVLGASPFIDIQQIEVDVQGPRLVLSGRLESYYQKQLVQQAVRFAYPLIEVIDDLRVVSRAH